MVHRDVKPENVLLTSSNDIKICDFGIARLLLDGCESDDTCSTDGESSPLTPASRVRAYSTVGSDLYAAPEVCMGDGYGTAVDVYSLGVTIYILLCGYPPAFDIQDDGEAGVSFPESNWSHVSEDAKDLIRQMLEADPEQRTTAENALKSQWITRHACTNHFRRNSNGRAAQRRSSHLFSLSPIKARPSTDLEMVKARLYKNLDGDRKRTASKLSTGTRKRRRMPRRSERLGGVLMPLLPEQDLSLSEEEDSLMAVTMADLYRGVASAAMSATKAAKGVVYDQYDKDVQILADESNDELSCDDISVDELTV
jgi:serine/threonine protein kinase